MDKAGTELVAPCGMYCGACSAYLAHSRGIPRKMGKIIHCAGCRPRNKNCAHLKKWCDHLASGEVEFCFECGVFPCDRLKRVDERYRKNYNTRIIENLNEIRDRGVDKFIERQQKSHECAKCGDAVSVHSGRCYDCEQIESRGV